MDNKKVLRNEYIFNLSMYILSIAVLISSNTFPKAKLKAGYGAGMFPMLIGWLILALNTILLIRNIIKSRKNSKKSLSTEEAGQDAVVENSDVSEKKHAIYRNKPLISVACVLLYALTIDYIGFLLSSFLLVLAMTLMMGSKWKMAVIVSLGSAVVIYSLFQVLLRVPLPIGTVFGG